VYAVRLQLIVATQWAVGNGAYRACPRSTAGQGTLTGSAANTLRRDTSGHVRDT